MKCPTLFQADGTVLNVVSLFEVKNGLPESLLTNEISTDKE